MGKKANSHKMNRWTQREISRLRLLYPMGHNKDLARIFGRTITSILGKAKKLGIQKDWAGGYSVPQPNNWTKDEIKELQDLYLTLSDNEIATKLKRTKQAVQSKVKKLRLFRKLKEQGLMRRKSVGVNKWSDAEIDTLKKLYPEKSKKDIAEKLGRSPRAVEIMARRLKLITCISEKNLWTTEEEEFLKKHIAIWPIEKIAQKFGRTANAVQRRAWDNHFTKNCRNKHYTQDKFWTRQETRQLEYFLGQRLKMKDIAAKLGRSTKSVKAKAKRLRLKKPSVWTTKNLALLKKYFPFETNVNVAKRIGTNPSSLMLKVIELGLKKSIFAKRR